MTLATSLRNAARTLINTFGNSASLYSYSGATKSENTEGDVAVSDWGSATAITVVDGDNMKEELAKSMQGMESIGDDEKIVRDNVTISVNDRLTANSVEYRVESLREVRTQDTLIIQIITLSREGQTSDW